MITKSHIEWTEATWNPTTGCNKISPGCKNCYADRLAKRLKAMGLQKYRNGFELTLHPDTLDIPLRLRKPSVIFVNSMSDLFHKDIPVHFIQRVFRTMQAAHWHTFQVLTKRAERLAEVAEHLTWPANVWMGVSVENQKYEYRVRHLQSVAAATKFLSVEPMIGPVEFSSLEGIDWVIVGGESGPKARPIKPEWVRSVRDQCLNERVAFFFKQWGGVNKSRTGRTLDGRIWDEMPKTFQNRVIA